MRYRLLLLASAPLLPLRALTADEVEDLCCDAEMWWAPMVATLARRMCNHVEREARKMDELIDRARA